MIRVEKRSGRIQEFDPSKIQRALLMAFTATVPDAIPDVSPLVHAACRKLGGDDTTVEVIQDAIEQVLIEGGHTITARHYIRHREERSRRRAQRLRPDSEAIPGYIHVGKYAKHLPSKGRREVYSETVGRVEYMMLDRFPELYDEIIEGYDAVRGKRVLPSMRSMQFGGAAALVHNERMYNCSFTHVDRLRAFQEIFFLLLCGCGAGYSVQFHHVEKLPSLVKGKQVRHFIIPDSIEGWADALGFLIQSYVEGFYAEFAYHEIRDEGSPLKTSGGRAPGHVPLKRMLERVRGILDAAVGRKLRPIECHDILCHVAEAVLAGGIRRSSLICLFSPDDSEMLYCKTKGVFRPAWGNDPGLNPQREMANNSALLLRGKTKRDVFERVVRVARENFGCPGFYWSNSTEYGCNPCGEIGLEPTIATCIDHGYGPVDTLCCEKAYLSSGIQFCNLCEVNVAACETREDLIHAAILAARIGTLQASFTNFPYLGEVTEAITRRDALLGVGLTGMMDNPGVAFDYDALTEAAEAAIEENKRVAAIIGINPAKRVTTVKPSGTASLELGCVGSGIHPHHARRYFRRVTANPNETPAQYFRSVNPHMVDVKPNGDWSIVFPVCAPEDAETVKTMPAARFVDHVLRVFDAWIKPGSPNGDLTHNVSCTVTIREEEYEEILDTIWDQQDSIAAMSFAPYLLDTLFQYAPRKEVLTAEDEVRWNELIRLYRPVDWTKFEEVDDGTERRLTIACVGGDC